MRGIPDITLRFPFFSAALTSSQVSASLALRDEAAVLAEDVRMTENHFPAHALYAVGNVEEALLLGDAGIEDQMVHKVSNFLGNLPGVGADDGVAQFVNLLLRHRAYGFHSLLRIPGTSFPERVHHIQQAAERGHFLFFGMHIYIRSA